MLTIILFIFFSPFLSASKREVVADYALPVAVLTMSFIGSYVFSDISRKYSTTKLTSQIPPDQLRPGEGGALVFQAGYHPRKRTFKTHPQHIFFRYEIDPNYMFLHVFFLICPLCPFQNLST